MKQQEVFGFSWGFLDEIAAWSLGLGGVIALGGGLLLKSVAFAVGCLIAVAVDVALVRLATGRARRELAAGRIDPVAPMIMLAGRLIVKAGILVTSLLIPMAHGFAGTVAGALVFDTTLVVVGSILAAYRTMRHSGRGGEVG
ncbi:MAG: hypothetical protein HGB10_08670 [Coriobacteriia bacterium]|nr:hypothetical protein [Coriobacteriia bacterium]